MYPMNRTSVFLLAMGAAVAGLLAGCGGEGDSGSGFTETFVPGMSLGGVLLGETYQAVVADHGNPTGTPTVQDGTVFWGNSLMITFADSDGNGQLSAADNVASLMGISDNGQGRYRYNGVGTGSTPADIIAAFGQPNLYADISTIMIYATANGTRMSFIIYQGAVTDIIISVD